MRSCLGSPTYFADPPPNEGDHRPDRYVAPAPDGNLLSRKLGAAVVAVRRAGAMHAFDSINHLFLITTAGGGGSTYWNLGLGGHKGEVADDAEGIKTWPISARTWRGRWSGSPAREPAAQGSRAAGAPSP